MNTVAEDFQSPDVQDVEFERDNLDNTYLGHQVNPARIEQIHREIIFSDLVANMTGKTGSEINCPFHGRDSTPSFQVYPPARGNNGWCFGCPPGSQFYDHVRFVRELTGLSFPKAVSWLENEYKLAHIDDIPEDEEPDEKESEIVISIDFADLVEPYILKAQKEIQASQDIEQAEDFLRIYFEAEQCVSLAEAHEKTREIEDAEERAKEIEQLQSKAALLLAQVLGKEAVYEIARRK